MQESRGPLGPKSPKSLTKVFPGLLTQSVKKYQKKSQQTRKESKWCQNQCSGTCSTLFDTPGGEAREDRFLRLLGGFWGSGVWRPPLSTLTYHPSGNGGILISRKLHLGLHLQGSSKSSIPTSRSATMDFGHQHGGSKTPHLHCHVILIGLGQELNLHLPLQCNSELTTRNIKLFCHNLRRMAPLQTGKIGSICHFSPCFAC